MDGDPGSLKHSIIDKLSGKAHLNQKIFDNTFSVFGRLKEVLHEISSDVDDILEAEGKEEVKIEYRDRGKFEAQLQIADDILLFNMHSNIFEFNREHPVWQNTYVQQDRANSYCGMINIYNFLFDSFRYNRTEDEGYLIGRIFINREMQFFVEGKNQERYNFRHFGAARIDREAIIDILESAIEYALDFDLFVPPYSSVKTATVEQFNTKMEISKFPTGKRMGFDFDVDETIPEIRKEKSGNPDENF